MPVPKGEWSYTVDFEILNAMQSWGIVPQQWRNMSIEDRALVIAWYRTKNRMTAVENFEQEREIERAKRKGKR